MSGHKHIEMSTIGTISGGIFGTLTVGIVVQTIVLAVLGACIGAIVGFFVTRWLRRTFGDETEVTKAVKNEKT